MYKDVRTYVSILEGVLSGFSIRSFKISSLRLTQEVVLLEPTSPANNAVPIQDLIVVTVVDDVTILNTVVVDSKLARNRN